MNVLSEITKKLALTFANVKSESTTLFDEVKLSAISLARDEKELITTDSEEQNKSKVKTTFPREQYRFPAHRRQRGWLETNPTELVPDLGFHFYLLKMLSLAYIRQLPEPISSAISSSNTQSGVFVKNWVKSKLIGPIPQWSSDALKEVLSDELPSTKIQISHLQFIILIDLIYSTVPDDVRKEILTDTLIAQEPGYFGELRSKSLVNYSAETVVRPKKEPALDTTMTIRNKIKISLAKDEAIDKGDVPTANYNENLQHLLVSLVRTSLAVLQQIKNLNGIDESRKNALADIFRSLVSKHLTHEYKLEKLPINDSQITMEPLPESTISSNLSSVSSTDDCSDRQEKPSVVASTTNPLPLQGVLSESSTTVSIDSPSRKESDATSQADVPAILDSQMPSAVARKSSVPKKKQVSIYTLDVVRSKDKQRTDELSAKMKEDKLPTIEDLTVTAKEQLENAQRVIKQLLEEYEQKMAQVIDELNYIDRIKLNSARLFEGTMTKEIVDHANSHIVLENAVINNLKQEQRKATEYAKDILVNLYAITHFAEKYPSYEVNRGDIEKSFMGYQQALARERAALVNNVRVKYKEAIDGELEKFNGDIKRIRLEIDSINPDLAAIENSLKVKSLELYAISPQQIGYENLESFIGDNSRKLTVSFNAKKQEFSETVINEFNRKYTYKKYNAEHFRDDDAAEKIAHRWWDSAWWGWGVRQFCNWKTGEDHDSRLRDANKAVAIFKAISAGEKLPNSEDTSAKDHGWPLTVGLRVDYSNQREQYEQAYREIDKEHAIIDKNKKVCRDEMKEIETQIAELVKTKTKLLDQSRDLARELSQHESRCKVITDLGEKINRIDIGLSETEQNPRRLKEISDELERHISVSQVQARKIVVGA